MFSDLPILLKMKLTNVSKKSIVCSLNFLDVKGPYITLVGEDTKKTISIPASVPPPSSEITFTEIGPNGFWHLEAVLHARELRRLFNSNKAIRIEIVARTIGKDPETMQKTICFGESQIDLIGTN
ncbi:hypothetical protein [Pseudoduganella buxea]|uniref:Uncharacterized protein n=1 Tax=Pseudoduganella buxea TaxID=1949069 RepID=A0A6I3SX11_9BURK|nr:hypothetical protein [Pseudoduganella buxea]MTV53574.1 hypothetical protein [Pseudoduganella buxea]